MTFSDSRNFLVITSLNVTSLSFLLSPYGILIMCILDFLILLSKSCFFSFIFCICLWIYFLGSDFQFTDSSAVTNLLNLSFKFLSFFLNPRSSTIWTILYRLLFLAYIFRFLFLETKDLKISKSLPWPLGLHQQKKKDLQRNLCLRYEHFFSTLPQIMSGGKGRPRTVCPWEMTASFTAPILIDSPLLSTLKSLQSHYAYVLVFVSHTRSAGLSGHPSYPKIIPILL